MKTPKRTPLTATVLRAVIGALCIFNLEPAFAGTRTWNGGATPTVIGPIRETGTAWHPRTRICWFSAGQFIDVLAVP